MATTLRKQEDTGYQRFLLSRRLVYQKNKYQSTAISNKEYLRIIHSIDYVIAHAKEGTVEERYEKGKMVIEQQLSELKQLLQRLLQNQQSVMPNERYHSILRQQLPDFLDTYDPSYHATFCKEDFDYPLLDGLALHHDMYGKQGVDFVIDYMERYAIEEQFLLKYQDQLPAFYALYEKQYQISMEWLGCNLCELVLRQALFSFSLASSSLFLEESQITYITQHCQHIDQENYLTRLYHAFCSQFSRKLKAYLLKHEESVLTPIRIAIDHHCLDQLMIANKSYEVNTIKFTESCDSDEFEKVKSNIVKAKSVQQCVEFILQSAMGIHDYIDLFESDIIMEEEYYLLFHQLSSTSIAVLFHEQYQEACVFHQNITLSQEDLSTFTIHHDWECYFIQFLASLPKNHKQEVLAILKRLS